MMKIVKLIPAFFIAVLVAYLLMSVMGTQYVLADVESYGLVVSLSDRISATVHDLYGLLPAMLIIVSATFLIAFMLAALGVRIAGGGRRYWFLAAGLASLPATMMLIKQTMGIKPFAPAGSTLGMLLIAFCGFAGAYVYVRLTKNRGPE